MRFLYDFLNHREGEVFSPVEIRKRLREFKKYVRGCASLKKYKAIFRGYAAEVTVNSKEGNFLSGFHPRIWPLGFRRSFCICFFQGNGEGRWCNHSSDQNLGFWCSFFPEAKFMYSFVGVFGHNPLVEETMNSKEEHS